MIYILLSVSVEEKLYVMFNQRGKFILTYKIERIIYEIYFSTKL